jgi:hypothetical protein
MIHRVLMAGPMHGRQASMRTLPGFGCSPAWITEILSWRSLPAYS